MSSMCQEQTSCLFFDMKLRDLWTFGLFCPVPADPLSRVRGQLHNCRHNPASMCSCGRKAAGKPFCAVHKPVSIRGNGIIDIIYFNFPLPRRSDRYCSVASNGRLFSWLESMSLIKIVRFFILKLYLVSSIAQNIFLFNLDNFIKFTRPSRLITKTLAPFDSLRLLISS